AGAGSRAAGGPRRSSRSRPREGGHGPVAGTLPARVRAVTPRERARPGQQPQGAAREEAARLHRRSRRATTPRPSVRAGRAHAGRCGGGRASLAGAAAAGERRLGRAQPHSAYVDVVLQGASAPSGVPQPVVLRARVKAMSKAISVAEVSRRCAEELGLLTRSSSVLRGMAEEGPHRRDAPELEIRLDLLRKVDTVVEGHDEAMEMILSQLRHLELQVGLENQDEVFTEENIKKILAAEQELKMDTNLYAGHLNDAARNLDNALDTEARTMEELYRAEQAENRYKGYPHNGIATGYTGYKSGAIDLRGAGWLT
ncbi:unnamed protein product, partial [Prorocentrum cordatum]